MLFTAKGKIAYSARLRAEGLTKLTGVYAYGLGFARMGKVQTRSGGRQTTQEYDIDGFVNETAIVLHFTYEGKLQYSAELAPKGNDLLSGQYASGELRGNEGIRSVRVGAGMGFGGAYIRAHVKFIDVATGKVKLEQDVLGHYKGGEPVYATTDLAKEIAKLVKGKGAL